LASKSPSRGWFAPPPPEICRNSRTILQWSIVGKPRN
jgi:hypothetical protein